MLEHASWTIALLRVSRAFTHQLVRHRVGFAFSQLSQQYYDESDARFVRQPEIDYFPEAADLWDEAVRQSQATYRKLLDILAAANRSALSMERSEATRALRSAARSVLPNSTETAIVVTANARALRHFFKVRGGIVGDVEMRCVAATLLQLIRPDGPSLFSDFFNQAFGGWYTPDSSLPLNVIPRADLA